VQVPETFEYERASSIEDAIALLERHGDEARLIAGGHSLLPMMKLRLAFPEVLIDINDVPGLDHIRVDGDEIAIGAMVRHAELLDSPTARRALPDLPRRRAGHRRSAGPQPRHDRRVAVPGRPGRGPVRRRSPRWGQRGHPLVERSRTVPMREFHEGPYETKVGRRRDPHRGPLPDPPGAAAPTRRSSGAWATGRSPPPARSCNSTATPSPTPGSGWPPSAPSTSSCRRPRTPCVGSPATRETFEAAAQLCHDHCSPVADQRGPEDYKRHLARELTLRALTRATARARGEES
jgi:aerobic carbon-monoxide dehydrogenase medium subunit